MNIDVNASAFVYRSLLRSIEFVQRRRMENFVFPSLDFREVCISIKFLEFNFVI